MFRIGNFKVNVIDGRDEETVSNSAQKPTASRANKALWTAIGRIAGEVTNGHEWSRLLDATARLLKAGVGDDFGDVGVGGLDKDVTYSDLVKLATLNATQSGTQFAKECAPSDVVGNLRALVWISESKHSGSISKNGANAIAQAAYTKAVEMSDFELKSAIIFLDALCKVEKGMEGKGNGNTVSTFGGAFDGNAPNDNNTSGKKKKKGTKNSAVEKKNEKRKTRRQPILRRRLRRESRAREIRNRGAAKRDASFDFTETAAAETEKRPRCFGGPSFGGNRETRKEGKRKEEYCGGRW